MPRKTEVGKVTFGEAGRKVPVMQFVRENPEMAAAISKTVKDTGLSNQRSITDPQNQSGAGYMNPILQDIAVGISEKIRDAQIVKEMLPDVGMALDILESSIISPNDMMTCKCNFINEEPTVSTELNAELLNIVKEFTDKDYKINDQLPKMVREVIGRSGAYIVTAIPESAIDDVINSDRRISLEDFRGAAVDKNQKSLSLTGALGYLGEPTKTQIPMTPRLAMESLINNGMSPPIEYSDITVPEDFVTGFKSAFPSIGNVNANAFSIGITDNFDFLKTPALADKMREQKMAKIKAKHRRSISLESDEALFNGIKEMTDDAVKNLLYKQRHYEHRPVVTVKSQNQLNRRTIGASLIMHLPTESVKPVFVPGDKTRQIAYLVLLDAFGYPIDMEDGLSQYNQLMNNMQYGQNPTGATGNYAMQQNNRADYMTHGNNTMSQINAFGLKTQEYAALVDKELTQRVKTGVNPDGAMIADLPEVARVMLARALSQQRTTILFLPADMVTYIAIDYDANGIGKSLLDDGRILHSQRIQVSVANVLASIKNSIGLTNVNIKFDEDEGDPRKLVPAIADMVMAGRQNMMPMGMFNPTDIAYWAVKSGLRFSFEGAASMPDVKIDYEETNTNYVKPDTDYEESLQKRSHASLRVPTELIDSAYGPDFATGIAQNHVIFSRRIAVYQSILMPLVSKHMRQVIHADQRLYDRLRKTIIDNYSALSPEYTESEKSMLKDRDKLYIAKYTVNKVLRAWIESLNLTLPSPDTTTIKAQQEMLGEYESFVDKGLEAYVNSEVFTSLFVGETLSSNIDAIKNMLKAHAMREFIVKKNILPELQSIFLASEKGVATALRESNLFLNTSTKQFINFLSMRKMVSDKTEEMTQAVGLVSGSASTSSTDSSTASSEPDDDFGGDFGLGGDEDETASTGTTEADEGATSGAPAKDTATVDETKTTDDTATSETGAEEQS